MGGASTFPSFPCLPPEVQNMVWQEAIYSVRSRIVEVIANEEQAPDSRRSRYNRKKQFVSPCPIPGVLHACRVSRNLALKRWRLCFAARYQEPKIFFDHGEDFLYFGRTFINIRDFADAVDFEDLVATQNLAFHLVYQWASEYFCDGQELCMVLNEHFPNLRLLVLPEYDLDQLAEIGAQLCRRSSRRAKPEQPKAKRDHKKTVIRFCTTDRDIDYENESTDLVFECLEEYQDVGLREPAILRVDHFKSDLIDAEYNEDQRRLEIALFTKYRAEMLARGRKTSVKAPFSESPDAKLDDPSSSAGESPIKVPNGLSRADHLQSFNALLARIDWW